MPNQIGVSVIIPFRNAESYIRDAIAAALGQTYRDLEVIAVDDGSNDSGPELVRKMNDPRVRLIRHPVRRGVCEARNTAMSVARGRWIAPLDADDSWHPERLARLLDVCESGTPSFAATDAMICFTDPTTGRMIPWKTFREDRNLDWGPIVRPTAAECVKYGLDLKPIFPRDLVASRGLVFDPARLGHEWLLLMLRLYAMGLTFIVINEPLYLYRVDHVSWSTSYAAVLAEHEASQYLGKAPWVDPMAAGEFRKLTRRTEYRLILSAFREKRWGTALRNLLRFPASGLFAVGPFFRYLRRRGAFRRRRA